MKCHRWPYMSRTGILCLVQGTRLHGAREMKFFVCVQSSSSKLRTNDQFLSLTDQLNLGVRAVELDTHWVEVITQVLSTCFLILLRVQKTP